MVNIVQSGLYLRVRWRLIMVPKDVLSGAQNAVQAAKGAFSDFQRSVPAVPTVLHTRPTFLLFCFNMVYMCLHCCTVMLFDFKVLVPFQLAQGGCKI